MRREEAVQLRFVDLDLERGAVRLDANKTDDARTWPLAPGTAAALRAWKKLRSAKGADPVFVQQRGRAIMDNHLADRYRAHLRAAGITRAELFETSANRRHVTFHATRAAFVTVSLAAGESEWKVTDKTGHKDASQIAKYRRQARTAAELDLGAFEPMDKAIPELRAAPTPDKTSDDGSGSTSGSTGPEREPTEANGSVEWAQSSAKRRQATEAAAFRFQWGNSRGGSSPPLRTTAESLSNPSLAPDAPTAHNTDTLPQALPLSPQAAAVAGLLAQAGRALAQGDAATAHALSSAAAALLAPPSAPTPIVLRDDGPVLAPEVTHDAPITPIAARRRPA